MINWSNSDKKILDLIKKECSQILDLYKNHKKYLYRGVKNFNLITGKIYPKEDRKPLDIDKSFHDFLVMIFDRLNLGVNRNNCLFCTTDMWFASSFGNVFVVFPKNDFKYVWSEKIFDLYTDIDGICNNITRNNDNIIYLKDNMERIRIFEIKKIYLDIFYEEILKILHEEYKDISVIDKDRRTNKIHDIIINNKNIFNFSNSSFKNLLNLYCLPYHKSEFLHDIFFKEFKKLYKNTEIEKCLYSGHEIMLRAEYFYLVKFKNFLDVKNFLFN
ncbi:MAG: hypothetical protein NZZ41_00340 [Candidatus Dojkabacteria bacterium]|nr:hypothetical protein [Candidatus Dojkabacteria bacterium]